jgi:hypothetical protein
VSGERETSEEMAEAMVELLRDDLRTLTPPLTPVEREKRERIVEQWEAGELTHEQLKFRLTELWIDDWPVNGLTQFIRRTVLEGEPFLDALSAADRETRELVGRMLDEKLSEA